MKNRDKKSISDTVLAVKCQSFLYCFRRFISLFIFLGLFSKAAVSAPARLDAVFMYNQGSPLLLPRISSRPPKGPRTAGDDRSESRACGAASRGLCARRGSSL